MTLAENRSILGGNKKLCTQQVSGRGTFLLQAAVLSKYILMIFFLFLGLHSHDIFAAMLDRSPPGF